MKIGKLLRFGRAAVRAGDQQEEAPQNRDSPASERLPRMPRVVRWAWASAVTTGIVMALANGQSISRSEVLQLLKAVTALVEEEQPARAKDQPPLQLEGPPVYVPDPKWGR